MSQIIEPKPPKASLRDLINLTFQVSAIMELADQSDTEFAILADRFDLDTYIKFLELNAGLSLSEDVHSQIQKDSLPFMAEILKLKLKFNIPRPYIIAEEVGIQINPIYKQSISGHGPSYPSGHSALSRFVANKISSLTHLTEDQYLELYRLADKIAVSRIHLGVHSLQDIQEGKRLADAWMDNQKSKSSL